MPLFQRRERQREKAQRVASGESIPLVEDLTKETRGRLLFAIQDAAPVLGLSQADSVSQFAGLLRAIVQRDWGTPVLAGRSTPFEDVAMLVIDTGTTKQVIDVLEAVPNALDFLDQQGNLSPYEGTRLKAQFRETVNEILDDGDVAYQLVDGQIVPRASMVMYADVVEPALSLLRQSGHLNKVEKAYQDALKELKPGGDPADAITDAATALQEMLVAVGADGNALGPLLSSARKRGFLGPHDSKLAEGVKAIGDWVSADRSSRGDAHLVTDATSDDAWLAVHVVGALIVRLAKRA